MQYQRDTRATSGKSFRVISGFDLEYFCQRFAPLDLLQALHKSCKFRNVFAPPNLTGIMWSNSGSSLLSHSTHRPLSRCQTSIFSFGMDSRRLGTRDTGRGFGSRFGGAKSRSAIILTSTFWRFLKSMKTVALFLWPLHSYLN